MTTRLKQVSRGTVWLARVLTTEARELITCAELALSDVQDEGVGSHAEVTSALSQGEMGEGEGAESHDTRALRGAWCPRLQPRGPLSSLRVDKKSGASCPGFESWLCPFLAL